MLWRLGDKLGLDLMRVHDDKAAKDRVCGMVTAQEKGTIVQCIRHTDTDADLMRWVDSGDYLDLMRVVNNRRGYSKQLAVKHRATRSRTVMSMVVEAAGASKPDSELRKIARRMGMRAIVDALPPLIRPQMHIRDLMNPCRCTGPRCHKIRPPHRQMMYSWDHK